MFRNVIPFTTPTSYHYDKSVPRQPVEEQNATFPAPAFSIGPSERCQGQCQVQGYAGYTCCVLSAGF